MSTIRSRTTSVDLTFAMAIGVAACAGANAPRALPATMTLAPPSPLRAATDAATIVFFCVGGPPGAHVPVVDENNQSLGELSPGTRLVVQVPPGRHLFATWAHNTEALSAEVDASRLYFAVVDLHTGALYPE